jgi:hypothetical protein
MAAATRASWKNLPMPEARARIPYARAFDRAEHERVARGIVPAQMEDKWFVFYEAPWLWFHRSWTGVAIYAVRLRLEDEAAGTSAVEEAWANRASEQYRETDDAHDAAILSFLVERILLGRDAPFPIRPTVDPAKASLLVHHVVGHARSNDEE